MPRENELLFLPLGGSGEIGMNMNLFALGPAEARDWIMIDCGVTFADNKLPGIDLICPDPTYILNEIRQAGGKLHGLVLTHGHEDHIGAVAMLWPLLKCPVYATAFTAELVRRKFEERGIIDPPLNVIEMSGSLKLGPFDLEFVTLTHSIPEPNGIFVRTEFGTILHTGDWKIDQDPALGPLTDSEALEEAGKAGVLAMVCDSTNVFTAGESGSESVVKQHLIDVIGRQKNRVAVTTFASNVSRLVSVCEAAAAHDRSVCLMGRSMLRMVDVARVTGLLPESLSFIDPKDAGYLPKDKVLYLCTGSQGEPRAALARIARDDHREIVMEEGDTVIFSSKIIPGNEREIFDLQNALVELGIKVITEKDEFIHVSGHPCRDELETMYQWVKPEIAIPVHGEARHLEEHARFAKKMGCEKVFSPRNGTLIRIAPGKPGIIDEVPAGRLYEDGHILLPEGANPIRGRRKLGWAGHITAAIAFNAKGSLMAPVEISADGIPDENREGEHFREALEDLLDELVESLPKARRGKDEEAERSAKRAIKDYCNIHWGKIPLVRILILRG